MTNAEKAIGVLDEYNGGHVRLDVQANAIAMAQVFAILDLADAIRSK